MATSSLRLGRVVERPVEQRRFDGCTTIGDVAAWLTSSARRIPDALALLDELCWRLVAIGIPLARMTFHLPTLHPQYYGTGARWTRASGTTEETLVVHGTRDTAMYLDSPIRRVVENGERIRRRLEGPDAVLDFPILADLKAQGITEYIAVPLELSTRRVSITISTDQPGGFRDETLGELASLGPFLAPILELQISRQITVNLLGAYLGQEIGERVLAGDIMRGRGDTVRAIVWLCDLRGFTRLSDHLPGPRVIAILNAYFERVVQQIHQRDGEVLKFMGDGLLAIFAVADAAFAPDAAARALDAAKAAIAAVDDLHGNPVLEDEAVPRMCVSIHFGDVFFGNIGAVDRLDFTAIGPAVNLLARLDQLTKRLERRILVTDDFARVCPHPLQSVGTHPLRGLSEPHEIFTPADSRPESVP
ncbi:MAG: adenylate/guanylate cyclase domain-containing protein [Alphaproteobacteria bacterium]|nr:adenylate/guanylate cyclase domain-containing protein [Alphaproteobacteria bacterium]